MAFNSNWLSDWSKRIEVTIDHDKIDSDLTNFPVLLEIVDPAGTNNASPMSNIRAELSISDFDFSDDFTEGFNIKKWRKSEPGNSTIEIVGTKLTATVPTTGSPLYPWVSSSQRWNFTSSSFSIEAYQGYNPGSTTSEDWLNYLVLRDKDDPSNNAAQIQFYYNSASYSPPILVRSAVKNGGAYDYGTATYTSASSFKTRIVRNGSTIDKYYDIGSGWVLGDSTSCSSWGNNVEVLCMLYNMDTSGGGTTASIWIDEIVINSGTIYHYYGREKLAVTDENHNLLPTEREEMSFRLNRIYLWTRVPTVYAGRDTKLYIYYDHTKADNTAYLGDVGSGPGTDVWDANFVGVYHLDEDLTGGAGSVYDSSGSRDMTPSNFSSSDDVTGKIYKGARMDSNNNLFDPSGPDASSLTIEALNYTPTDATGGTNRSWIQKGQVGGSNIDYGLQMSNGTGAWLYVGSTSNYKGKNPVLSHDTWNYIGISYNGSAGEATLQVNDTYYSDGELTTGGSPGSVPDNNYDMNIGMWGSQYGDQHIFDEVRISNIERTAAWRKATYYTCFDNLVSYTNEQSYPPSVISGTLYDKYSRPMTTPCKVIVSDLDGQFVVSDVTAGNGRFEIPVPAAPSERFIVTFYKEGKYGLDYDIAGAKFMTPVATTSG
jgi:hypothetical protein